VGKYIFLNYYSDLESNRRKELIFCVNKNIELDFIKKVFIFVEKQEEIKDLNNLKKFKKICFILTKKKRIYISDIFEYAKKKLEKNSICIAVSCDIFLKNSSAWKNIDNNFFKKGHQDKILLGIRKNLYENKLSKRQIKWEKYSEPQGEYFDVLVFKNPIKNKLMNENLKFIWGIPGGDSLLMGLINKHYHIFSWGKKYITYHFDVVRKKEENPKFIFNHIPVNKNFLISAMLRVDEAARVPTRQDWQVLLKEKIKPKCIYLKDQNEKFFTKYFRKIYYFLLLNLLKKLSKFIDIVK
jgi:hypothetical protein